MYIKALLTETRLETLSSRRTKHMLTLFYKMKNNLYPPYLASLVPNNVRDVSRYNLRNVQHSQTVHANTQLYFHSFLPSVIRSHKRIELQGMLCQSIKFLYHPSSKTIFSRKSSCTNLSCKTENRLLYLTSPSLLKKHN